MNQLRITKFASLGYAGQEALNTLCTNLSFAGENIKKVMITSSHASEGKSFLSMNIMRTMARYGKRVVLVDADLRRSYLATNYKLQFVENKLKYGLAHYLTGKTDADSVIYETNIDGASMIPVGREVANPLPLFNSPRFGELLDYLAEQFDYVFVDVAPVGVVIDAAEIAKSCDGALLVVNYNAVRRRELIDVKEQIDQTGCPIIGTVLNMVRFDNYLSRKYYYKSHYSNYGYYYRSERRDDKGGKENRHRKKKVKE